MVFSPLGIIFILLIAFFNRKKAKFIYSAFILLIVFSNGFVSNSLWRLLEYPWKRLDYSLIGSAEGIVVLSTSRHLPPGNSQIIEWSDPDRFLAGIDLYKSKKSNKLIFTGGINPLNSSLIAPEGEIYLEEAISMGVPRKDLFTTSAVTNTFDEAKAIKQLFQMQIPSSKKKIILVTSAFHMKRAKKVFEREGITVLPYPVDFHGGESFLYSLRNPLNWVPSSYHLNKSSNAIREIIGRIVYRVWE